MGNKLACIGHEQESEKGGSSFMCGICMETVPAEKRFKMKKCTHPFCHDCISKHIHYKVLDNVAGVECPHPGCAKLLDPVSCRPILPADVFLRWCDVLCESMVVDRPHAYCPNTRCSALVLDECARKEAARRTRARCPSCKRLFCFQCKVEWHAGYLCDESAVRRDSGDILFGRLAEKKRWQRCPKCKACVEIKGGCHIITCRCKFLFCYRCGKKYSLLHPLYCPAF